jgi:hypothetical protein
MKLTRISVILIIILSFVCGYSYSLDQPPSGSGLDTVISGEIIIKLKDTKITKSSQTISSAIITPEYQPKSVTYLIPESVQEQIVRKIDENKSLRKQYNFTTTLSMNRLLLLEYGGISAEKTLEIIDALS